jgi:phosphoesterase RecJ-like protein
MHAPSSPPSPAWREIAAAFDQHQRFIVTTHVNPDGDGLGAELGLWAYLRRRGKEVRIINPDPLPSRYEFLGEEGEFETYDPAVHDSVIEKTQLVVVLDISRWERLAGLGERLRHASVKTVCIDHHPFEDNGMADLYAVDLEAAATGQLVYELIRKWGHEVDRQMALGFYVSILTDTGSFRFSNSDARAHRVAADLLQTGLDPSELYEMVYGNSSLARIRLLGEALREMQVEEEGRILILLLSRAMLERTGAHASDTEGFVDVARSVRGCEAVALLLERKDGRVKASLRSRGRLDINRVARAFGGGGHQLASGATVAGPLNEARERILAELRRAMEEMDPKRAPAP